MQTARLEIHDCGWLRLNFKVVGFDVEVRSDGVKPHCLHSVTVQASGMSAFLTDVPFYKASANFAVAPNSLHVLLSSLP